VALRVGVLISGEGTNLQAILDTVHGHDGIEVVCVASSREGAPGLERARRAGVQAAVHAQADHPDREARDLALGDWLERHSVDLIVLAGFMDLLGGPFIRRFKGRIVNVHPSLLPAFPGLRAIEQAIEYGVPLMGVTVHFVDEGVDSGPVILQESFEPEASDRGGSGSDSAARVEKIERRVHEIEHRLLPEVVRLIAAGAVSIDPDNPRIVRVNR
jgi:phosphoribosylglycinamide formyltransferase-1